jgi:hypothetical protein
MIQKWFQKNDFILGEIPLGAPLVVQTVFGMKKLPPSAPKVRPRTTNKQNNRKKIKHEPKMAPKRAPRVKKSSKSGFFSQQKNDA